MNAEIWTKPLCSACQDEKATLRRQGYTLREYTVGKLDAMDRDAHAQLQIQDGMLPVVRIGGRFRMPKAVSQAMSWD